MTSDFKIELFDKLNLAPDTIKGYKNVAHNMNQWKGTTKLSSSSAMIKKIIKNVPNKNVRAIYYSALIKYFELIKKTNSKAYLKYKEINKSTIQEHQKEPKVLTDSQKKGDYKKGRTAFTTHIKGKEYQTSASEMLLSFYLYFTPRRNVYSMMKFVTNESGVEEEKNYLFKHNNKYYFIFGRFKTDKTFGTQKFLINDNKLIKILDKKDFKHGDIVYSKSKRTALRDIVKETKKYFGVELNINDLRVLHSTSKFGKAKKEMVIDAKRSAHSLNTKIKDYIRNK